MTEIDHQGNWNAAYEHRLQWNLKRGLSKDDAERCAKVYAEEYLAEIERGTSEGTARSRAKDKGQECNRDVLKRIDK